MISQKDRKTCKFTFPYAVHRNETSATIRRLMMTSNIFHVQGGHSCLPFVSFGLLNQPTYS